jgi:hypothetical protein
MKEYHLAVQKGNKGKGPAEESPVTSLRDLFERKVLLGYPPSTMALWNSAAEQNHSPNTTEPWFLVAGNERNA